MNAKGGIFHATTHIANREPRVEMRQVKETSRNSDGQPLTGIETKKPHSRFAARLYVGPQVQFGKGIQDWAGRHSTRRHSFHPERHDADIRGAIVQVQFESFRYQSTK